MKHYVKNFIEIHIPAEGLHNSLKVYQIDLCYQSALPVRKNLSRF